MNKKMSLEELKAIDQIVANEKGKARVVKPGKEFSRYINKRRNPA